MPRLLVIQTAFPGDVVLTLPLIQSAKRLIKDAEVDLVCTPSTAPLVANHPAIFRVMVYDKRRDRAGMHLLHVFRPLLRSHRYDVVLSPHRSIRSALLARISGAPVRIAFRTASGSFLYTHLVPYHQGEHEIDRVLTLLDPLGCAGEMDRQPRLHPGEEERDVVDQFIREKGMESGFIAMAPGSVWETKRWILEGFARVARKCVEDGRPVVLIGGESDGRLCAEISAAAGTASCISAAGRFSLLASAELIRRATLLVSNDSAPVHLASAVGTPVVDIYGPTIPAFGFTPYGVPHRILEREGLVCRPCGIHGGRKCPIGTFVCMKELEWEKVYAAVVSLASRGRSGSS